MKRRNGLWHKEKQIRRLQEKRDALRVEARKVEYVALEKPVFAGWDIHVGLTKEGINRRDAEELQEVVNYLNLNEYRFTKDVKLVRHIRHHNFSVDSYRSYYKYYSWFYLGQNRHISFHRYHNLEEHLKLYFYADYKYKHSTEDRPYYNLKAYFPWYAFRLYITKSYHAYRGIPNSQAESDYDKLNADLYVWDRKTYRDRWKDNFVRTNKFSFKMALKTIVNMQYTPEEIIDDYPKIFRKTNNQRDYGWS